MQSVVVLFLCGKAPLPANGTLLLLKQDQKQDPDAAVLAKHRASRVKRDTIHCLRPPQPPPPPPSTATEFRKQGGERQDTKFAGFAGLRATSE